MAYALVAPMKGMAKFYTYSPSGIRASVLADEVNGTQFEELAKIPAADIYMIGCKPQQFEELAKNIRGLIPNSATVISIMAGITVAKIQKKLNIEAVIRTMPNTPAIVGRGVVALHSSCAVSPTIVEKITKLFESGSQVFSFDDESMIDVITPFSGSGPAYLFELGRIFSEQMVQMGVSSEIAQKMIAQTFAGSAQMMVSSEKSFEELRTDVTSKNGVTYEALKVFQDSGLPSIAKSAIDAAYSRAKELSL